MEKIPGKRLRYRLFLNFSFQKKKKIEFVRERNIIYLVTLLLLPPPSPLISLFLSENIYQILFLHYNYTIDKLHTNK